MEFIVDLLVGLALCAVFGVVIYVLAKKDREKTLERLNNMTEEQKKMLSETPDQRVDGMPNAVLTQGLVVEVTKKSERKVALVVMFYNTYFPNMQDEFQHADINISMDECVEHNVVPGKYVKILLNQDKGAKVVY